MEFTEEEIEEMIWKASQTEEGKEILAERGLVIDGKMFRQLNLNPYGIADIITIEWPLEFERAVVTVYELKRGMIDEETLMQAAKYVTALQHFLDDYDVEFEMCLIGKNIQTKGDFVLLYNLISKVRIYTYTFGLEGVTFHLEPQNWYTEGELNAETKRKLTKSLKELEEEREKADQEIDDYLKAHNEV